MSQARQKVGWFFFDSESGEILLHRRDDNTDEAPNMWDLFGGKIEEGEEPIGALAREVYEELDISITENEAQLFIGDQVKCIYCIRFPQWKTRAIKLYEGAGFVWTSIGDALKLTDLTDEARQILLEFDGWQDSTPGVESGYADVQS